MAIFRSFRAGVSAQLPFINHARSILVVSADIYFRYLRRSLREQISGPGFRWSKQVSAGCLASQIPNPGENLSSNARNPVITRRFFRPIFPTVAKHKKHTLRVNSAWLARVSKENEKREWRRGGVNRNKGAKRKKK